MLLGGLAWRHWLVGIFVFELVEREADARPRSARFLRRPPARRETVRAISSGDFRCRSALGSSRRPAVSSVTCSRMQVTTSCSARRSGA